MLLMPHLSWSTLAGASVSLWDLTLEFSLTRWQLPLTLHHLQVPLLWSALSLIALETLPWAQIASQIPPMDSFNWLP